MAEKKEKTNRIDCTSCGAPVTIRVPGKSQSLACDYCGSVLDTTSEAYQVIGKFNRDNKIKPLFELGSRAVFEDEEFELVGFLRKKDNYGSKWDEYLLYSPYLGYRYLSYWMGHWNYITLLNGLVFDRYDTPVLPSSLSNQANKNGTTYKKFFKYSATVEYVIGEFNWRVKRGEKTSVVDYINPPESISGEFNNNEAVYSHALYVEPPAIARAFQYDGELPRPVHVAPNQPNPFKPRFWLGLVLGLVMIGTVIGSLVHYESKAENKILYNKALSKNLLSLPIKREGVERYKEFQWELGDIEINGDKNLEIEISTALKDQWMNLTFFLMNEETQKGYSFTQLMSFYDGYSDGEYWSEGSNKESLQTVKLKPGTYYTIVVGQTNLRRFARAEIKITRDVIGYAVPFTVIIILFIPLIYYYLRKRFFEQRRNS